MNNKGNSWPYARLPLDPNHPFVSLWRTESTGPTLDKKANAWVDACYQRQKLTVSLYRNTVRLHLCNIDSSWILVHFLCKLCSI
jgi:hypothetical protein